MKGIKYIILLLTNDTLYLAAMRKMKAAATTGNGFLILIYSTFYIFFIYFFYYLFILFYFIYLILFFILFINFRVFVSCFRVVCCVFMSHIIASHKAHTTQKTTASFGNGSLHFQLLSLYQATTFSNGSSGFRDQCPDIILFCACF